MKNCLINLLFSCLLILHANSAHAQHKYSRVKIYDDIADPYRQKNFIHGTLQVDHCHFEGDAYVVEIGEAEMQQLRWSSYRYEIIVDDIAEHFRLTNDVSGFYENDRQARLGFTSPCQQINTMIPTPTAFTPGGMGGYYTYAEMVTKMGNLINAYPGIVDTFSIGRSIEGRNIWCIKISDNVVSDENEAEVMFNGLQHAREAIGGTALIFFAQYLAENYASNTSVQQLVNNREIFIIPCVNPDGYVYNQTTNPSGGGNWRKNRRPLGGGEYGVDLNRNYNADWGNCNAPVAGAVGSCGSGVASSSNGTYWGTGPFSEPETRAIRDFTAARNFRMSIDQHSEGAYNTLPHGRVSLHPNHNLTDSQFLYGFASSAMATYNCHRLGNNLQTLDYEVAGGNKDWMFQGDTSMDVNPRKIYSFTSEAGGGSFWPVASQIIPLSKGLVFQYLQATLVAGGYADLHDASDVAIIAPDGAFDFSLRRVGILDAPITVSLIPLQNITTTGAPMIIPTGTLPNYYSTTTGSITYNLPAALANGQIVRFIWRVEVDGISIDDTITKIYNPVTVLYDDMETGLASSRWAVSSNWAYTTTGQGLNGAGRALTESPSGNYSSGSTRTVTWNTAIDLSNATAAYLSFWVRHRSENCQDILRVRISTDGGTSYNNLCGKLTISENRGSLAGQPGLTGIREEWSRELFDLSNYIGAGMNNIRVQFQFISNTDPSDGVDPYYKKTDDGFYLDNIRLVKSTSPIAVLPARFLSFDGRLVSDGNVELNWNAETDSQHLYFEVERSRNGANFIALGRVNTAPPCRFIDGAAQPGMNYYRIKQVDKDGTISYSRTINIAYNKGTINFIVYPNPVTDILKLRLSAARNEMITVTISDVTGRKLVEQKQLVTSTGTSMDISLAKYASEVLLLTIRNSRQEVIATQKIIRQ
jgi:carboxypeptidase T